jgi:hypothetical protein
MAYNDMINWALEKVDILTRIILNDQVVVVALFRLEHIQVMYKLSPNPKYIYNVEFTDEFQRKECTEVCQTYPNFIKGWWRCPSKFSADTHGISSTTYLNEYMVYVAIILCRLFEK